MAIGFKDVAGKAKKGLGQYTFKDGDNAVRLIGKILPRYVYWLKAKNNKDIPVECLSFDRDAEAFLNLETNWVSHYYPDLKCSWAYAVLAIDLKENKLVVFNLKKKLFEAIKVTAEDLGDPTDPVNGWDVLFKKVKTGPSNFNVEYTLQPLKCKKRPLTEEELALIPTEDIDHFVPRLSAEAQLEFIKKNLFSEPTEGDESNSAEIPEELKETPADI